MKKSVSKRIASAFVAGVLMVSPIISSVTASAAKVLTTSPSHTQEVGWYNDYHHEIWQADTPNSSTMTLHDNDGGFSTSWKCGPNGSRGNFLARRGLYWGLNNPKTYKDYGDFYCDYDCNWQAGSSGNSRICIYGWAQNPLVEYYIIEDWKNWSPAQDSSAQYKGSVNIDGSEYKIYTSARNS
ncbi:MAG: glycoside hydrolase family 11 protein, partial [Ruminococcus sp.]